MSVVEVEVKETVTSKVNKTVCDRCSTIIEDQEFSYYADAYSGKVEIGVEYRNQGGGCTHKYDLCDPCSKQLKQWIEVV